ncbi:MAG: hypothetical protein K8R99_12780 [Actinomycetia bacterium]|nr:hypothetical protein [Actinomycetes bacterium]
MSELDTPIRALPPLMLAATIAAFVFATVGAVVDGRAGTVAAGLAVSTIVAIPLLRVVIVGVHWLRIGDRRFAVVAAVLLAVVGLGAILAVL